MAGVEIPCIHCGNAAAEISLSGEQARGLLTAIAGEIPGALQKILARLIVRSDEPGTVLGLQPAEFSTAFHVRCIACVDGGPAGGPYKQHDSRGTNVG